MLVPALGLVFFVVWCSFGVGAFVIGRFGRWRGVSSGFVVLTKSDVIISASEAGFRFFG